MKKKLLKLIPRSALLSAILIFLVCTTALAATILVIILSDMNIIPGETTAKVYLDPEATIEVTVVHWGDVQRGTHQQFIFYVKNTGVEPIDASMIISENVSSFMDYTFTPANIPLSAGEVGQFTFEADVLPTAELGGKSWHYQVTTP